MNNETEVKTNKNHRFAIYSINEWRKLRDSITDAVMKIDPDQQRLVFMTASKMLTDALSTANRVVNGDDDGVGAFATKYLRGRNFVILGLIRKDYIVDGIAVKTTFPTALPHRRVKGYKDGKIFLTGLPLFKKEYLYPDELNCVISDDLADSIDRFAKENVRSFPTEQKNGKTFMAADTDKVFRN